MAVEFQLHDIGELLSWVDAQGEAGKKAVSYTIKDIKSRAPGWVAAEAAAVYNIKKSEITPAKTEEDRNKKAVSVYVSGNTLSTVSIVYRGRNLTPIHFSMSPKRPPTGKKKNRAYSISFEVIKGSRFKIRGKPDLRTPFLAPNKGKNKRKSGEEPAYIVFQRKGVARTDMYSVRTVSVPQMLGNSHVKSKVEKKFYNAAEQRLKHHIGRFALK